MSWETRGGKRYYYRSKSVNGRTVKEYVGSGPKAEEAARLDAEAAVERRRKHEEFQALVAKHAEIGALMDQLDAECDAMMLAVMTPLGFHKYRGEWRKKRKPKEAPIPDGPAQTGGAC